MVGSICRPAQPDRDRVLTSALILGNEAARAGQLDAARLHYAQALLEQPAMAEVVFGNLLRLSRQAPPSASPLRVTVAGFELGHNAAGRAQVLADLHARAGSAVDIVGPVLLPYREVWPPLRDAAMPRRVFSLASPGAILAHLLPLVAAQRADVVHLSKARGPNLLTAALYKLWWNSTVVLDVDDEELGFVGARDPLSSPQWRSLPAEARSLQQLYGREWTQLAVGMVSAFDGVTAANAALQQRYGGEVLRHARDERELVPSLQRGAAARARFGVPAAARVVLFFGTPRAHKGLLDVARALASIEGDRWRLVIVGDFEDQAFRRDLLAVRPGLVQCLPGQPFAAIPDVLSIADVCVVLHQEQAVASRLQTPAKLTDALAMGVPVLASASPGVREFVEWDAVCVTTPETLATDLVALCEASDAEHRRVGLIERGRNAFLAHLSFASQSTRLQQIITAARARALSGAPVLSWPPVEVLRWVLRGIA